MKPLRRFPSLALLAVTLTITACGEGDSASDGAGGEDAAAPMSDAGPTHVHGLGTDRADGSLYIATHSGLFRAPEGRGKATRIGASQQDVMGFSIPEKGRFIGSGHPDPDDSDQPPHLGLIESGDRGKTWKQVSLAGKADFHVLRSSGKRIYGSNGLDQMLMVSEDGGGHWESYSPPGPLVDLAVDPADPDRLVASTDQALFRSSNRGRSWRPLPDAAPGLLAWSKTDALYRIDGEGTAYRSKSAGHRWTEGIGSIGGQPAALIASRDGLYAALPGGTVKRSTDGGANWVTRSAP